MRELFFGHASLSINVIYKLTIATLVWLAVLSWQWRRKARRAELGANAERIVGELLAPLTHEGWDVTPNHMLSFGGDIDVIVRSPRGEVYAVEVKSVRGTVRDVSVYMTDGESLAALLRHLEDGGMQTRLGLTPPSTKSRSRKPRPCGQILLLSSPPTLNTHRRRRGNGS